MIKEFFKKLNIKTAIVGFYPNYVYDKMFSPQLGRAREGSGCSIKEKIKVKKRTKIKFKIIKTPPAFQASSPAGEAYSWRKKVAFTLAEVLITLAVVGVVAAITIPNLHNTYQKAVFKAQLKKTDAYVHQLYQEWYNEGVLAYNNNSLLAGHGGLTLMTEENKCADKSKYKCLGGTWPTGTDFFGTVFCLKDGRPLMISRKLSAWASNPNVFWGSHFFIFVDINGYDKGPNFLGVDLFTWEVTPNGIKPTGVPGTYDCTRRADCLCKKRDTYDRTSGRGCTYKALHDPNYFDDWKWKYHR